MNQSIINSSKDQLEDFKDSTVWKDISMELMIWREGFNLEMLSLVGDAESNNPSTASVLMHLGDLNGRQKAVDYMLDLPNTFLNILKMKDKKEK